MTAAEIAKLEPCERVAGYLLYSSKLAVILSRLRKNGRRDETWTEEETKEWELACDDLDPWWYALSTEDQDALLPAQVVIAAASNGEWPLKS